MNTHMQKEATTQIPHGWRMMRLRDVAEVNRSAWNPLDGSSLLYIDLTAVVAPGRLSAPKEMAATKAPSRARRRVKPGDILVRHSATEPQGICTDPAGSR